MHDVSYGEHRRRWLSHGTGEGLAANKLSLTGLAIQSERNGFRSRGSLRVIGYTLGIEGVC